MFAGQRSGFFLMLGCLVALLGAQTAIPYPSNSVWTTLGQQFSFDHQVERPEVQAQIRWLIKHPYYLEQLSKSEPYLYHILSEIKQRQLPGELALLPMIESAYNPLAYSSAGAAGLWQIMPGTGSDFGLTQDWWYDARRSIPSSTGAALNYLEYLHRLFHGDWILAIAAYDAGEGAIHRCIKANQHRDFWLLSVPKETQAYVPRLLALAEIIQHAEHYHVPLPIIPNAPYFQQLTVGSHIDLNHAAQLAGISYQDLLKLNPGYNHWTTAPNRPYQLLIPASHLEQFSRNLLHFSQPHKVALLRYWVKTGEHIDEIAARLHTTVKVLKALNHLSSTDLSTRQFLLIPSRQYPAIQPRSPNRFAKLSVYKTIYIVDKNESFASISQKMHVKIEQIKQWNQLTPTAKLQLGQSLVIWKSR